MLDVRNDNLVVEEKGIYSIEKFIVARRLMYWQVYLHKTVLAAEFRMMQIMQRARALARAGEKLFGTPELCYFLEAAPGREAFENDPSLIDRFAELDDHDLFSAIKVWARHPDFVLSHLCHGLIYRELNRVILQNEPFDEVLLQQMKAAVQKHYGVGEAEVAYFVQHGTLTNDAYLPEKDKIMILRKDGSLREVIELSDNFNLNALTQTVVKHYLSVPKAIAPKTSL
jgi:HD superfamily phosphohydrolase